MRIGVLVATAPLLAAGAPSPVPSPSPSPRWRPSLEVVGENPVVVEGRRFAGNERVTLKASIAGRHYEVVVTADADGHFKAQVAETDAQCAVYRVSAAGDRRSRAITPRRIPPPCGMKEQQ